MYGQLKTQVVYHKEHLLFKYDVEVWKHEKRGYNKLKPVVELTNQEDKPTRSERIVLRTALVDEVVGRRKVDYLYDGKHLLFTTEPILAKKEVVLNFKDGYGVAGDYHVEISNESPQKQGDLNDNLLMTLLEIGTSKPFVKLFGFELLQRSVMFDNNESGWVDERTGIAVRRAYKKQAEILPSFEGNLGLASIVVIDIKHEAFYGLQTPLFLHDLLRKRLFFGETVKKFEENFEGVILGVKYDLSQRVKFHRFSDVPIGQLVVNGTNQLVPAFLYNKYGIEVKMAFPAMVTEEGQYYPMEYLFPIAGQFASKEARRGTNLQKHLDEVENFKQVRGIHSIMRDHSAFFEKFGIFLKGTTMVDESFYSDSGYADSLDLRSRCPSGEF
ncbi:unnamed protein product [Bursaphelenchus okinawaensis]|uniref:PAZ domain-containing protein n=1 Tax=Bursaphelenchus okinawaensis TaxID=465554 RepID=A0A811LT64_9BILA|nr:unnamed protein product [Bursaphelenchus okinawaensis]CAG9128473.1 unnamed protein product [Bursaphelenchus okinawaensis]